MINFTRPADEKPYYYSSTVENGQVIKHEGDPAHAVYQSEIAESQRRSNLWHKWLEANVPDAYSTDGLGIVQDDVMAKYHDVCRQFMDGERSE